MRKIKAIIYGTIVILILGLLGTSIIQYKKISNLEEELSIAINNNKAYELENLDLKDKAIVFKQSIEQLNYSKDSILNKLNAARKQLKIKDSKIKELEYIASTNFKTDTLRLVDTVFKEGFCLDTVIADQWAKLQLQLNYPSSIVADYGFKNSTSVITSVKKETVKPPKKCWLGRLFQKKQLIYMIDIVQENPYCTIDKIKRVEIVNGK